MTKHPMGYCAGIAALVVSIVGCSPGSDSSGNVGPAVESGAVAPTESPGRIAVTLPDAKLEAAGIRVQPAAMREIPEVHTVPGRIDYDDRRHVAVCVATSGIMVDIRVKPGDKVESGQPLAVVSSPELGEVRADVLRRQAEWEIAQRKYEWEAEIESNLTPFVAALRQRVDIKELDQQFRTLTLGEHREKLVAAFARWTLAESLMKNADTVASSGILAGRTLQERASERAAADAALLAACEQSTFDARQRKDQAALAVADAQRRLEISRQQLRTLLGYEPASQSGSADQDLSLVEVRAPFAGTIERRNFSTAERVQPNDELFILADTTRLWVVADVREKDWGATRIEPGESITVRVPAIPDRIHRPGALCRTRSFHRQQRLVRRRGAGEPGRSVAARSVCPGGPDD
jgi:cobalt-zinc-cadmium efflux system membrane fusion protein